MEHSKSKHDLEKLLSSFVDNEVRNNGFSINPENLMERFDEMYSIIRALIMVPDLKSYNLSCLKDNSKFNYANHEKFVDDFVMVSLVNSLYEDNFRNTSFQDRAVFLPHCLGIDISRNKKSRSQVDGIKEFAVSKGYNPDKIFVVGGGSEIPSLMDGCSAMLGLCCITDAKAYVDAYKAGEIDGHKLPGAVQMCLLDRKGCKDTFVNIDYVFERLSLIPRFVENSIIK